MGVLDPRNLPPGPLPAPYDHLQLHPGPRCGGQGAVYYATDHRSGRPLGVKFFDRDQTPHDADLAALMEFGQRVPDESFSRTYEVIDLRRDPAWNLVGITMAYLDWSFEKLLEEAKRQTWKFPAKTVERWVRELAQALDYLIAHGRVHRDLKPDNLGLRLLPNPELQDRGTLTAAPAGDRAQDFHSAHLLVIDLGTLAQEGREAGTIRPNDRYKHPDLYPEKCQVPRSAMDLYAFAELLEDFRALSDEPLPWLDTAQARCRDILHPLGAGVLPRLVSPTWKTQAQLYREAGFETQGLEKFVGRDWIFDAFDAFRNGLKPAPHGGVFLIVGPAGCGKSMLLRELSRRTGDLQGFYFRVGVRTTAEQMVESIGAQLGELLVALAKDEGRKAIEDDAQLRNIRNFPAEQQLQIWIDKIAARVNAPPGLLLFIDALDETETPGAAEAVVKALPRRLPPGYFLVLSSRPPLPDWNYLNLLREAPAEGRSAFRELPIDLQSEGNKDDVRKFLARELGRSREDADIQALADHCGHVFLLASFQAEAIRRGHLTLAEALHDSVDWLQCAPEDRLRVYYRTTWDRIMGARGKEGGQGAKLADFLAGISSVMVVEFVQATMAVLGSHGIDEQSLCRWLAPTGDWNVTRVRNLNQLFLWFVESVGQGVPRDDNPSYRVRHKSIRDFLTSGTGPIAPADVRRWHGRIAQFYLRQAGYPEGRAWDGVEPYGIRHVVQHLLESLEPKVGAADRFHNPEAWQQAADILTQWDYLGVCLNGIVPNSWV